jgi:transposase-like protein
MKGKEFQALIGQLGALSEGQRAALLKALSGAKKPDEVIRLIEMQFDASPRCGHCGSALFKRWGVNAGLKRYKCKDCDRTFNALTGTPLMNLKHRDRWLAYAKALVDGVSLRKAAKRARLDLTTAFRWRHRFLQGPKTTKAAAVTGIVEADEAFFLKSAKGSKRLVGRAPRKRGGTAKKKGLSPDEHTPVLIVRDRHGATTDAMLPDLQGATIARVLQPVVAKDALLVSDGRAAYGQFADASGLLHIKLVTSKGEYTYGSYHIQNVNAYISRLKRWMRRFNGVATRYLENYLGWWRMIDRMGQTLTPLTCIAAALPQAST